MKVKDFIEILKTMPQNADVYIQTQACKNGLKIKDVYNFESEVELTADDRDFELNEDGLYEIEKEQDEEAQFNAMNSAIDIALGK